MKEQVSSEHSLPLEISADRISPDALNGIIENFILREGTDYGAHEISLEVKVQQVRRQLDRGEIKIVFDPKLESVNLLTKSEWKTLSLSQDASAEKD